ncbi:hypothetical protein [Streptomyces radicis]|nr:hypothetical protein [Streptomyces radicis]
MVHGLPLAHALGLEGVALPRAFTGERHHDRAFVEARVVWHFRRRAS